MRFVPRHARNHINLLVSTFITLQLAKNAFGVHEVVESLFHRFGICVCVLVQFDGRNIFFFEFRAKLQ